MKPFSKPAIREVLESCLSLLISASISGMPSPHSLFLQIGSAIACRFPAYLPAFREYSMNGTVAFIRSGEIHDNKTELFITEEGLTNSSAKMVDIGDILYALYGATSGEVDISKIKGAINQAILCIQPLEQYNKKFIVEMLTFYKDYILRTYLQGGQGNLSAQIVQNLIFKFPCFEEQQKIANCLSDFDTAISLAKQELDKWKLLKKGLLQQMFV